VALLNSVGAGILYGGRGTGDGPSPIAALTGRERSLLLNTVGYSLLIVLIS